MPEVRQPRHGSMQIWPRSRTKRTHTRIRTWTETGEAKPLGFAGYKAGMTHLLVDDNRAKSLTKGESITLPATILDSPPMVVCGITFYRHTQKVSQILADKFDKHVGKTMSLPKKTRSFDQVPEFDDLRLLVHSQPVLTSTGTKKPKILEIALGGAKADKIGVMRALLSKVDSLIIGGVLANTFLKAKGVDIRKSKFDEESLQHAKEFIGNKKILLPVDVIVADRFEENADSKEVSINNNETQIPLGQTCQEGFVKTYIANHGEARFVDSSSNIASKRMLHI